MRFGLYATASLFAGAALVSYTYYTRQQFYPTVIYLVTSKVSVMILCNVAFVLVVLFGQLFKRIFLGTLRDAELEMLYDHGRFTIAETCFTLSVFREEMSLRVLGLFSILLFIKIFHWLCQWRGEHIEQSEIVSRITHIRLVLLMALLAAIDVGFVVISGLQVAELGPSVLLLFGFEFMILFVTLVSIFMRYILHLIDARVEGTWTNKFTYVFYLELFTEVVKLIVYLIFFMIIFTYYGMPLHLLRDLWISIKNLQRRVVTYFRYRRITANMNERFPCPTEEELNETDRICIICREEMTLDGSKKLPCSHIFHLNCLRMWLQRQQTCPTCRSNIPVDVPAPPDVIPRQENEAANDQPPVAPAAQPAPEQRPANPGQPAPIRQPFHGHRILHPERNLDAARHVGRIPPFPAPAPAGVAPTATPPANATNADLPRVPAHPIPNQIPFPTTFPFNVQAVEPNAHYIHSMHYGLQLDPRFLQYQLDMLQAQLYVLRATSSVLQGQTGLTIPPMNQPETQIFTGGSQPTPSPASNPPHSQAPLTSNEGNQEVNASAPESTETAQGRNDQTIAVGEAVHTKPALPVEMEPQPAPAPAPPLTPEEIEKERRREELRRIYAKRYGGSQEQEDE